MPYCPGSRGRWLLKSVHSRIRRKSVSAASACQALDSDIPLDTFPSPGATLPAEPVSTVEAQLRRSSNKKLRSEAVSLQAAINAHAEGQITAIVEYSEFVICPHLGVPPPM